MTGCGMPQLSAVYFAGKALHAVKANCEIIADGGIRSPGDANKYLAAGATGVMMGKAFSKTEESAGWHLVERTPNFSATLSFPMTRSYDKLKKYRGQASSDFQTDTFGKSNVCPEGAATDFFSPSGTCKSVIDMYVGGLSSAISYLGVKSSAEINPSNVNFVKLTHSSYQEGTPHGCS
jgi:IMP dehydrogenase